MVVGAARATTSPTDWGGGLGAREAAAPPSGESGKAGGARETGEVHVCFQSSAFLWSHEFPF